MLRRDERHKSAIGSSQSLAPSSQVDTSHISSSRSPDTSHMSNGASAAAPSPVAISTPATLSKGGTRLSLAVAGSPGLTDFTFGAGALGIDVHEVDGGSKIAIMRVEPPSQASALGVPVGAQLVAVNGSKVEGMRVDEVRRVIASIGLQPTHMRSQPDTPESSFGRGGGNIEPSERSPRHVSAEWLHTATAAAEASDEEAGLMDGNIVLPSPSPESPPQERKNGSPSPLAALAPRSPMPMRVHAPPKVATDAAPLVPLPTPPRKIRNRERVEGQVAEVEKTLQARKDLKAKVDADSSSAETKAARGGWLREAAATAASKASALEEKEDADKSRVAEEANEEAKAATCATAGADQLAEAEHRAAVCMQAAARGCQGRQKVKVVAAHKAAADAMRAKEELIAVGGAAKVEEVAARLRSEARAEIEAKLKADAHGDEALDEAEAEAAARKAARSTFEEAKRTFEKAKAVAEASQAATDGGHQVEGELITPPKSERRDGQVPVSPFKVALERVKAASEAKAMAAHLPDAMQQEASNAYREAVSELKAAVDQAAERITVKSFSTSAARGGAEVGADPSAVGAGAATDEQLAMLPEDEQCAHRVVDTLRAERGECASQIVAARARLAATEEATTSLSSRRAELSIAHEAELSHLQEVATSIEVVMAYSTRFRLQCGALSDDTVCVASPIGPETMRERRAVGGRVQAELEEARGRLEGQLAVKAEQAEELRRHQAATAPEIARQEKELSWLSAHAAAQARRHRLEARHADSLLAELRTLEASASDEAALEAQASRAAQTADVVASLRAAIAANEAGAAHAAQREEALGERARMAGTGHIAVSRALTQEADTVRTLLDLQELAISEEELPRTAAECEKRFHGTRAELAASSLGLLGDLAGSAKAVLAVIDEQRAEQKRANAQAAAALERERVAARTECAAASVAAEQRRAYLAEKERQLDSEHAEVERGRLARLEREHSLAAIRDDLAAARRVVDARKAAADAAASARDAAVEALRQLRLDSSRAEVAIRERISSEEEVLRAQRRYVTSLEGRAGAEASMIAEAEGLQSANGGRLHGAVAEAPIGTRGRALLRANNQKLDAYVAALATRLEETRALRANLESEHAAKQRQIEGERELVAGERAALQLTVAQLESYDASLTAAASAKRQVLSDGLPEASSTSLSPQLCARTALAPTPASAYASPRGKIE